MPGPATKTGGGFNIGLSQLQRIQQDLLPAAKREDPDRARAIALQAKSKQRAISWTNTLEGSRKANMAARSERFQAEEFERQKLDLQEANIQLENRRRIIARANRLLYDQSDRIKSMHSKMQLSDTLAEREAQVQLKDELNRLEQIREERFLEMGKHNYRKMLERELRERVELEDRQRECTKVQQEQLAASRAKTDQAKGDNRMEGELLREKAMEDAEVERKKFLKKRASAALAIVETQKANAYLRTCREEDDKRKEREQRKINEYAAHKEQQMLLRKARQKELEEDKQKVRQKLIDTQAAQLMAAKDSDEARVEQQVLEKNLADEQKRLAKEHRMQEWADEVDKSRRQQMARKNMERKIEKKEEIEMSQFWNEWCRHLDAQEKEEKATRFLAAKNLQRDHLKQIASKKAVSVREKDTEVLVVEKARQAMELDSLEYYKYSEAMIREYAEEGKNVIPLIKELKAYRKRQSE